MGREDELIIACAVVAQFSHHKFLMPYFISLNLIFSPQISYAVCTGTGRARSPVVQNSSLKRLPTISADNTSSFYDSDDADKMGGWFKL